VDSSEGQKRCFQELSSFLGKEVAARRKDSEPQPISVTALADGD
jgi:hypothetical protein